MDGLRLSQNVSSSGICALLIPFITFQSLIPGQIPSYKFLPLIYQLAARISSESSDLQLTLNRLISKLASEHPHHAVPVLLALRAASTDLSKSSVNTDTQVGLELCYPVTLVLDV